MKMRRRSKLGEDDFSFLKKICRKYVPVRVLRRMDKRRAKTIITSFMAIDEINMTMIVHYRKQRRAVRDWADLLVKNKRSITRRMPSRGEHIIHTYFQPNIPLSESICSFERQGLIYNYKLFKFNRLVILSMVNMSIEEIEYLGEMNRKFIFFGRRPMYYSEHLLRLKDSWVSKTGGRHLMNFIYEYVDGRAHAELIMDDLLTAREIQTIAVGLIKGLMMIRKIDIVIPFSPDHYVVRSDGTPVIVNYHDSMMNHRGLTYESHNYILEVLAIIADLFQCKRTPGTHDRRGCTTSAWDIVGSDSANTSGLSDLLSGDDDIERRMGAHGLSFLTNSMKRYVRGELKVVGDLGSHPYLSEDTDVVMY